MTALEQLPDSWDSDRDEAFFRITARLLPSSLVEGASALLASYDDEAPTVSPTGRTAPVAGSAAARPSLPTRVAG